MTDHMRHITHAGKPHSHRCASMVPDRQIQPWEHALSVVQPLAVPTHLICKVSATLLHCRRWLVHPSCLHLCCSQRNRLCSRRSMQLPHRYWWCDGLRRLSCGGLAGRAFHEGPCTASGALSQIPGHLTCLNTMSLLPCQGLHLPCLSQHTVHGILLSAQIGQDACCVMLRRAVQSYRWNAQQVIKPLVGVHLMESTTVGVSSPQCVLQERAGLEKHAQNEAHHKLWLHPAHQ